MGAFILSLVAFSQCTPCPETIEAWAVQYEIELTEEKREALLWGATEECWNYHVEGQKYARLQRPTH